MESEAGKSTVMARLGNLKNAEDDFRKVSIREDYTLEEREMVREYVKKAEANTWGEHARMEGPGDTENRIEGGENYQTAPVIDAVDN